MPSVQSAESVALPVAPNAHSSNHAVSTDAERWAAWQARGVAHDQAVRRRMMFAAPILIVAIVVAVLLLR